MALPTPSTSSKEQRRGPLARLGLRLKGSTGPRDSFQKQRRSTDDSSVRSFGTTSTTSLQQESSQSSTIKIWDAAFYGDLRRVQNRIERDGVPPAARDCSGYTALHHAAMRGHVNVCRYLAQDAGAPVNATARGSTPLHRAASFGRLAVVTCLVQDWGADATLRDAQGKTALDWAREKHHEEVVKFLQGHLSLEPSCSSVTEEETEEGTEQGEAE